MKKKKRSEVDIDVESPFEDRKDIFDGDPTFAKRKEQTSFRGCCKRTHLAQRHQ